ncbi:MAG TPA: DUF2098 domain-containing protein [Methanosarcinales archaeon]|nr:DUF2098 domain-containing protein [Methanosarcinales archaeon]
MSESIAAGDTVQYKGTGTIGKVKRFDQRDHETWALVDSSDLWYKVDTLEVLEGEVEAKEWDRKLTLDELKHANERSIDKIGRVQEILEVELCECGG